MPKKILIIDDNGHNGSMIGNVCLVSASEWEIAWLRVTTGKPDPIEGLPDAIAYDVVDNQTDAAAAIKQHATDDLIVFYDVQLIGVQEDTNDATDSLITRTLKDLMGDPKRQMLVNVHSADKNSFLVAGVIDPSKQRVQYEDAVTGKLLDVVKKIVSGTVEKWKSLYLRQSLDAEQFISVMANMTHEQIQAYPNFIKTRIAREGLTDAALRQKYPDPAAVLMSYLGMDTVEFEKNFCNGPKTLRGEVIEALKSISGIYELDEMRNLGRPLSWSGAWLLALGVFRGLQSRDQWTTVFNVADLRGPGEDGGQFKWPKMHAMQSPARRIETVRLFAEMIKVLFTKKGGPTESVLEKVVLNSKKQPNKFSFRLSFPCVGGDEDQSESLLGRVLGHVDLALALAGGKPVDRSGDQRDTSRAIWRFFLSASICDVKDSVRKPGYGMAGGFTPMNILSIDKNTKTEVLWQS